MKSQTTMTLAAAVLLAGATLAVVPASAALFSSSTSKASDSLSLSSQQQQTAWNDLNGAKASNAPASFQPATSSAMPEHADGPRHSGKNGQRRSRAAAL